MWAICRIQLTLTIKYSQLSTEEGVTSVSRPAEVNQKVQEGEEVRQHDVKETK